MRLDQNLPSLSLIFQAEEKGTKSSLGPGTKRLTRFWLVVLWGPGATINQAQQVLSGGRAGGGFASRRN